MNQAQNPENSPAGASDGRTPTWPALKARSHRRSAALWLGAALLVVVVVAMIWPSAEPKPGLWRYPDLRARLRGMGLYALNADFTETALHGRNVAQREFQPNIYTAVPSVTVYVAIGDHSEVVAVAIYQSADGKLTIKPDRPGVEEGDVHILYRAIRLGSLRWIEYLGDDLNAGKDLREFTWDGTAADGSAVVMSLIRKW